MAALFVVLEGAAQLGDAGMLLPAGTRFGLYFYGGFWDVFFEAVQAGEQVPWEFWSSIVTHAFLHGSAVHLVMNGVVFLSLGGLLANLLGTWRFVLLFCLTAAAGALTFAVITDTSGPLVGASGAVFGFFGILKRWEWRHIRQHGAPQRRFWGTIAGLIAINVALYYVLPGGGQLAWEAHLGGFVAGFVLGDVLGRGISGPSPI